MGKLRFFLALVVLTLLMSIVFADTNSDGNSLSNDTPTNNDLICGTMSYTKAKNIALNICGEITGTSSCNKVTNTWWFDLTLKRAGCSPACVVDTTTGNAEINYRCTGVIDVPIEPRACTEEYAPVCAEKQVQCVRAPCDPIKQTYSNKCMAENDGAKIIYEGECESDNSCICTKEYNPVCGITKACTLMACPESNPNCNTCFESKQTYSNACMAKCAGVNYYTQGDCETTCPMYAMPYCPNGNITMVQDERGCPRPKCVESQEQHFKGAYWKCSDGTEGKEYGSCMPYSYWKEYARKQCEMRQPKCITTNQTSSSTSGNSSSQGSTTNVVNSVGNFILQTVQAVTTSNTNTTDTNIQQEAKCYGYSATYLEDFKPLEECDPNNKVCEYSYENGCKIKKCSDGEVERTCEQQECKYYVDEQGCKIKACINGEREISCPTQEINPENPIELSYKSANWSCYSGKEFQYNFDSCVNYSDWKEKATSSCDMECSNSVSDSVSNNTVKCGVNSFAVYNPCNENKESVICSAQTVEEITELKTKCYANDMDLVINLDSKGCKEYVCKEKKQQEGCLKVEEISKEKKLYCEEREGTFIVKENSNGCVTYVECAGEKLIDENASINKNVLNDKEKLLDFVLKLETIKIELEQVRAKVKAIGEYYKEQDNNAYTNYESAILLIDEANSKIEEIKNLISENIDSMDEDKAKIIRTTIREIKENLLKDLLLKLLK